MEEYELKRSARLLFAATFFFWCSLYSYTQFIDPELERMGAGATFIGLVLGSYGLSQTLLRIPLGIAADRLGRQKPFVVMGSLLAALSCAFLLMFYTPAGFFVFRLLTGVASASWVSFTVMYSAYYPLNEGPGRVSHLNLANMSGRLAGFLLILLIVPAFGVRSAFTFSLLAGAAALFAAVRVREAPGSGEGITMRELLAVAKDKYLVSCSLVGILTQAVAFSTYYGFTVKAATALGAGSSELTWLNVALLAPTIAMNLMITRRLLPRFGAGALVSAGFVLSAAYALLVPLAAGMSQLYLLQVAGGVSSSLTFAVLLGQPIRDVSRERRAAAMGFFQAVYGIGMTLGPVVMGVMIDAAGLKAAFFAVALFSLLSAFVSRKLLGVPVPP